MKKAWMVQSIIFMERSTDEILASAEEHFYFDKRYATIKHQDLLIDAILEWGGVNEGFEEWIKTLKDVPPFRPNGDNNDDVDYNDERGYLLTLPIETLKRLCNNLTYDTRITIQGIEIR
ncbi:MAG: hypothetical protein ACTSUE_20090 [Promethearchaeota archaeon]